MNHRNLTAALILYVLGVVIHILGEFFIQAEAVILDTHKIIAEIGVTRLEAIAHHFIRFLKLNYRVEVGVEL
ncbi:MAG: hypothetical protein A2798_01555 [Candidatus Levybacteria bacterium RIFCSPHIGHO2_01_FULL_37_17]|nr:MAG: hypothetical protein A2798_01555 [Candidatus Levybacteria bacterium RIFCSPHIGHO2_01_FULL_37_17]OGH37135.1 MAG: hypothetical protein A2959_02415 [Candidatus Levybacteria bacterium RIFCSPLOWO2_01_FULL_38_23]